MTHELRKTPFYKVSISDSSGTSFVDLPYFVHRLVEKIEIKEMLGTGWCIPAQFSIYFIEGSREPYPTNQQINTSVGYPIDNDGSGSLTNNTGMLADLRYIKTSGGNSITSIPPSATGLIVDNLSAAAEAGSSIAANLEQASSKSPKFISMDSSVTKKHPVQYLFENRNRVRIEWGYIEDLSNRRGVQGHVAGIELEFPENDQPKLKVNIVEPSLHLDQVAGIFGTSFFNKTVEGSTAFGAPIETYKNISVKKLIEEFCSKAKMAPPMVSDIYDTIQLDKYAHHIIPMGMSPNQFFGELSKKYDAYYKVFVDSATNQDTIAFLNKQEYNAKSLNDDIALLTYRSPGSIIKSIQLKAEYVKLPGHAKSGVTEDGKLTAVASKTAIGLSTVSKGANLVDSDPTGNNPVGAAKGSIAALNTPFTVGTGEYSSEMNDINTVKHQVASKNHCQTNGNIALNLTSIGYSKLRPGPWRISGLGERFSMVYYFYEVTHVIDSSGYTCSAIANSDSTLETSGLPPKQANETQEAKQASVGLTTVSEGTSASDKFSKSQESH